MLKWKSTGPRRHSGNIILLPLILDHFQFQHPLSSPYAAKSQKGDVIWSCLTNFMSKTLLKSISSFFIWNSTAFIQWIPLTWTNTTTSKLVSLTPVYPLPRPWIYPPYMHPPHCSWSDLCKTHMWSSHSQVLNGFEFIHQFIQQIPNAPALWKQR